LERIGEENEMVTDEVVEGNIIEGLKV